MAPTSQSKQLVDDVRRLYESRAFSDFVVKTHDGKEFHVHRNVLGTRSKVFMAMLTTENSKEVLTGKCEVTDVDGPTMDILLQYVYGTTHFSSLGDMGIAVTLLYAAEKYDLPGLVQLCAEALQTSWKTSSAAEVLQAANRLMLPALKKFALTAIAKDRREFIRSGQLELVRNYSLDLMEEVLKGVRNSGEAFTARAYCPGGRLVTCPCPYDALRKGFDADVVYP